MAASSSAAAGWARSWVAQRRLLGGAGTKLVGRYPGTLRSTVHGMVHGTKCAAVRAVSLQLRDTRRRVREVPCSWHLILAPVRRGGTCVGRRGFHAAGSSPAPSLPRARGPPVEPGPPNYF